jgi:hypothetical protein
VNEGEFRQGKTSVKTLVRALLARAKRLAEQAERPDALDSIEFGCLDRASQRLHRRRCHRKRVTEAGLFRRSQALESSEGALQELAGTTRLGIALQFERLATANVRRKGRPACGTSP